MTDRRQVTGRENTVPRPNTEQSRPSRADDEGPAV